MMTTLILLFISFFLSLIGTWTDTKENKTLGVIFTLLLSLFLVLSISQKIKDNREKQRTTKITKEIESLYFKGYHEFILKKLEKDDKERANAIAKSDKADEKFKKLIEEIDSSIFEKIELRYRYRYFENNYPLSRKLNNLKFKLLRFKSSQLQGSEVDYIQYGCEVDKQVVLAVYYTLISGGRKIRSIQQKDCIYRNDNNNKILITEDNKPNDKTANEQKNYNITISSDNQANLERECDPIEFDQIQTAIEKAKRSPNEREVEQLEKDRQLIKRLCLLPKE